MVAHERWLTSGAAPPSSCPAPMTRAALVALRNAGTLSIQCHYVITDHVQGRLAAGTQIMMHADSTNELSMDVMVNTLFDNSAWPGRYDIDNGFITELRDNLDNIVIGLSSIGTFDWGNTNISNCRVENSTWNQTIGSTITYTDVRVLNQSTLDTRGQTAGFINNTTIDANGTVDIRNSNILLNNNQFRQCNFTAVGYTGGSGIAQSLISDGSTLNLSGTTSQAQITRLTLSGSSFVYTNVVTGSLVVQDVVAKEVTAITISPGALAVSLTYGTFEVASTLTNSAGALNFNGFRVMNSFINKTGTNSLQLLSARISSSTTFTVAGVTPNTVAFSGGTYDGLSFTQGAAGGLVTINNCSASSATITVNAGDFLAQRTIFEGTSSFVKNAGSTGAVLVQNSVIGGGSSISLTCANPFNFLGSTLHGNTSITQAAASGQVDIQNSQILATSGISCGGGTVGIAGCVVGPYGTVTKTGASAFSMSASRITGQSFLQMQATGAAVTQTFTNVSIEGASVITNAAGAGNLTALNCSLTGLCQWTSNAGVLSVSGCTFGRSIILKSATAAGAMTVTDCTVGSGTALTHQSAATFDLSGSVCQGVNIATGVAAGATTISGSDFSGTTSLSLNGGVFNAFRLFMNNSGTINKATASTMQLQETSIINCQTAINWIGLATNSLTTNRVTIKDFAAITSNAASDGALSLTDCELWNTASIALGAGSAGTMNFNGLSMSGSSLISKTVAGNLTLTRVTMSESSQILNGAGTRPHSVTDTLLTTSGALQLQGTGTGVTAIVGCRVSGGGSVVDNTSGVNGNTLTQSVIEGAGSIFNFNVTTASQNPSSVIVMGGASLTLTALTAVCTIQRLHLDTAAAVTFTTISAAKIIRNLTACDGAILNITGAVAGTVERVNLRSAATLQVSGTNTLVQDLDVSLGGTVAANGGTIARSVKSLLSTLTTGAFNHNDIYHHSNVSQTLTAANNFQGRDRFNNSLV